jgi:hypothetical protein
VSSLPVAMVVQSAMSATTINKGMKARQKNSTDFLLVIGFSINS